VEDWVLERLQEFVGRSDRQRLALRVQRALTWQEMGEQQSYRVVRNLPSLGHGLVVAEEGVIPDYERVRRVFHLTNAITKYYYSPFYLEEQVPGYHARIAWLGGRQVGFTRNGRYCAFATDRAPEFIPDEFFADNPKLVVGLTIGGNGIPYAKPSYRGDAEDIDVWATELLEHAVREPVDCAEKYEILEKYGIRGAPHAGPFDAGDLDEILAWMKGVEEGGGQGIVLKPSERHHRPLKYSVPSALEHGAPGWLGLDSEIDEDPYFERLAQAACAATEMQTDGDEWDWAAIGKSLLAPLAEAAQSVNRGEALTQDHSVWVHEKDAAVELLAQLEARTLGISIEQLSLDPDNDGWRLTFRRRFAEAGAALERRLSGASYRD